MANQFAAELAALIGMEQDFHRLAPKLDRHLQAFFHQLGTHPVGHGPAKYSPGPQILHCRKIKLVLKGSEFRDFGQQCTVRHSSLKRPIQVVRLHILPVFVPSRPPERLAIPRPDRMLPHDPAHSVQANRHSVAGQIPVDLPAACSFFSSRALQRMPSLFLGCRAPSSVAGSLPSTVQLQSPGCSAFHCPEKLLPLLPPTLPSIYAICPHGFPDWRPP